MKEFLWLFYNKSLLNSSSVVRVVEVTNNWWGVCAVVVGIVVEEDEEEDSWIRSQCVLKLDTEVLNEYVFAQSLHLAWPLPMSSKCSQIESDFRSIMIFHSFFKDKGRIRATSHNQMITLNTENSNG